jgi:hypothetical protein
MQRFALSTCLLAMSVAAQVVTPFAQDPHAPLTGDFEKSPIPAHSLYSEGIAIADVNGDGLGDLLVSALLASSTTAYGFRYYLNRGDGTFDDLSVVGTAGGPIGIAKFVVVDIDGDNDLDVVGTTSLLRNNHGVLVQEQLPATTSNRMCVAAGDIDGDGDQDLFFGVGFAGGPSRQDRLMINDGHGVFQFAPTNALPVDSDNTQDARFFDADGDGDLDLLLGIEQETANSGGARLYLNSGNGTFTDASANLPAPIVDVLAVLTGDFDLDGDQDVVLGTGANPLGIEQPDCFLRNLGGGQFALEANTLPGVLATTSDVISADIDGDGDVDLLLAEGGGSYRQQRIYRNDGTTFTDVSATWLPSEFLRGGYWAAGNLDADNQIDAALVSGSFASARPGRVRVFHNRGGTSFLLLNPSRAPASSWTSSYAWRELRYADVDGDGDVDVFAPVGSPNSPAGFDQVLLQNDGFARLTDVSSAALPPVQHAVLAAEFADIDSDGDPDLVLGTESGTVLWRNSGAGNFVLPPAGTMPAGIRRIASLCIGDVDNDGDLDIFAGSKALSMQDELLRNNGAGVFTRDTAALPTHFNTGVPSCAMLDYDGDGDLDLILVLASGTSGSMSVYQNNGLGAFTEVTGVLPSVPAVARITSFDADGDGDQDLILSHLTSTSFLLNQGGTFVAAQPTGLQTLLQSAQDVSLFDYEGDGDLDLSVYVGGTRRLLLNDGMFRFREVGEKLVEGSTSGLVNGADLDGDGDADFLVSSATRDPMVVVGRRVQLHAPWMARIGLPYDLELHYLIGALDRMAAAAFVLNSRRLASPLTVPSFGTLAVDPNGATLGFGFISLAQDSYLSLGLRFEFAMPNTPGLLGATIYSQALLLTERGGFSSNLVADRVQ